MQAPEALNPITHPDRAARRRALVLDAMVETGKITEDEATARDVRRRCRRTATSPEPAPRSYYIDAVLQQLLDDDPDSRGRRRRMARPHPDRARTTPCSAGGLRIYTNYDPRCSSWRLPRSANTLPDSRSSPPRSSSIDNANGAVRGDGHRPELRPRPVRPRDATAGPPGRLVVQGDHARGGARAGYSPDDRVSGSSISVDRPATGDVYDLTATVTAARRRSPRRSPTPTTARSCAPSCRSGPATTAETVCSRSSRWRTGWASTRRSSTGRASTTLGTNGVHPSRDGAGVLGDRRRRRPPHAAVHQPKIVDADGKVLYESQAERHPRHERERRPHARRRCSPGV